jgi:RNA polymerase-binding transcription factor DksA
MEVSMQETDGAAARMARRLDTVDIETRAETQTMPEVSEPYIREQLEKRREELQSTISIAPSGEQTAPLMELLQEVDLAIEHIHDGTYGTCVVCQGTVEQERLIANPLARVCLDCLSTEERRALEGDLELASTVQRGLLPQKATRFGDWHIHYEYKPAGAVSGDYCDLILPLESDGKLVFLLGDVAGKGLAAALLMTHLHAMFRSLANVGSGSRTDGGLDLEKLLGTANRVFCESTFAGQYATLVCGRAGKSGDIEIASAGHLPAVMVTRETDSRHRIAARNVFDESIFCAARANGAGRLFTFVHRWNLRSSQPDRHGIRNEAAGERCRRKTWVGAAGIAGGVYARHCWILVRNKAS